MTKLSDTQRIILSQASQRDDRLVVPPKRLPAWPLPPAIHHVSNVV